MIGCSSIITSSPPISHFFPGVIGRILPVIGRPPIELSAYLCRFRLLWEDDRRDRPVRDLSSLFTRAYPELADEARGQAELL